MITQIDNICSNSSNVSAFFVLSYLFVNQMLYILKKYNNHSTKWSWLDALMTLFQRRPVLRSSWIREARGCPPLTLCLPHTSRTTTAWATPPPSPPSNALSATPCTWGGSATGRTGTRPRWPACLPPGRRYRRAPAACRCSPPNCSTGPPSPDTQWALPERTARTPWPGLVADSPVSMRGAKGHPTP